MAKCMASGRRYRLQISEQHEVAVIILGCEKCKRLKKGCDGPVIQVIQETKKPLTNEGPT